MIDLSTRTKIVGNKSCIYPISLSDSIKYTETLREIHGCEFIGEDLPSRLMDIARGNSAHAKPLMFDMAYQMSDVTMKGSVPDSVRDWLFFSKPGWNALTLLDINDCEVESEEKLYALVQSSVLSSLKIFELVDELISAHELKSVEGAFFQTGPFLSAKSRVGFILPELPQTIDGYLWPINILKPERISEDVRKYLEDHPKARIDFPSEKSCVLDFRTLNFDELDEVGKRMSLIPYGVL